MNENSILSSEVLDELNGRYLLFYIGDRLFGVSLALVLEIIQIQHVSYLPGMPAYIKGIVNLRGKVVPVIDTRLKFGMEERPYDDKTCIVVLDIHDMHIGLIVDSVSEVLTVENSQLSAPPTINSMHSVEYLSSVTETDGKVVLNIDFDKFFQEDLDLGRI